MGMCLVLLQIDAPLSKQEWGGSGLRGQRWRQCADKGGREERVWGAEQINELNFNKGEPNTLNLGEKEIGK